MKKLLFLFFTFIMSFACASETITLNKKNTVRLSGAFDSYSTANVIAKVNELVHDKGLLETEKKIIYLVMDSPGGYIVPGLNMIDALNALKDKAEIRTIVLFGASMGFITTQMLGRRYVTEHGVLMSHKAAGGFQGEFPGQLDSRKNFWYKRIDSIDKAVVKRTNGIHTLDSYHALMENEYWCEGKDCVEQGFADDIANVVCDNSLKGTEEVNVVFSVFGLKVKTKVTRCSCPIVTGYIKKETTIDGKPYDYTDSTINTIIENKINPKLVIRYNLADLVR